MYPPSPAEKQALLKLLPKKNKPAIKYPTRKTFTPVGKLPQMLNFRFDDCTHVLLELSSPGIFNRVPAIKKQDVFEI